jgi:hypothetical protein
VAVAGELAAHGAAEGGVVGKKVGVVAAPHEFLLVSELGVGEGCVFFVERGVGAVLRCAAEEGTVFGGVGEGCVCVWCCMCVRLFCGWCICRVCVSLGFVV